MIEKSLKILMLEDSIVDAEIIQAFLIEQIPGCTFKIVMNEEAYIKALDLFKPDLIISDNTLPQFNATVALEIFNRRSLSIPFILVTGTVSEEFAAGIIKLGADDYILKDRMMRLPNAIDTALKSRKAEAAIRHSEEIRKLTMNAALDAIICVDTNGMINTWNQQAEKLFGWKEEEVIGRELVGLIFPEQYRKENERIFSHNPEKGNIPILNNVIELTGLNHSDNEFPIELAVVPTKQTGNDLFCVFIRDITERKNAEEKLRFKANLLNTVGQAVIATDTNGIVIYWNRAAEEIYGWTNAEAMGKNIGEFTPVQQNLDQAIKIKKALSTGKTWSGGLIMKRKDGIDFPALITDSPVYDQHGKLTAIIGVSVDITEQKNAEQVLRAMEKEIADQKILEQKKISRAVIKAEEEEKNRIGLELHDNINQILAGTKLHLGVAASKDEHIKAILKYPIELIDNTIEELRLLSSRQVTPLKNINLKDLIRTLLDTLCNNNSTNVSFDYLVPGEILTDDLKLNIYRLLQEQVNNIIKHAEAKNVGVLIEAGDKAIKIAVTDDGVGFNVNSKRRGIGISNMMNRIEFYNGEMKIESQPGNGSKITITIPYAN